MKTGLQQHIARIRRARDFRGVWPAGHRAALSLTFDDARVSQVRVGVPELDRLGVAATFFVLPDAVDAEPAAWREVASAGHEIGNHTLRHPCSGNFTWSRGRALEQLTIDDFRRELDDADDRIQERFGVRPVVFAYPCGQTFVGRGRDTRSLVPLVAERFLAGRTFNDVSANAPFHCDLAQVAAVNCDEHSFSRLQPRLEAALADRAWLVLGGHEIGACDADETTTTATIASVVHWCRDHDVWVDTVGAVARRVATAVADAGQAGRRPGARADT
jgi:peptidoglycan/xylan/chitin deacetylase (PgdA/CDA1 family)